MPFSLNIYCLTNYFLSFFGKRGVDFCKSLSSISMGIIHNQNCSTGEIAAAISDISGKSIIAADKQIRYLLSNKKFQVDDQLWRSYIKMLFNFLIENKQINQKSKIYIHLNYVNIKNNFLILCASIIYNNNAIPLYFTMRQYPKDKKISINQSKMEFAFINGLRHCLSIKYQYVIIASSEFARKDFIKHCEANNFKYAIELENVADLELSYPINNNSIEYKKNIFIPSWEIKENIIVKNKEDNDYLHLCTNLARAEINNAVIKFEYYHKIEGYFEFDIKNTKIRKYDRLKRLLFCICISQAVLGTISTILENEENNMKKNFPQASSLLLALCSLQKYKKHAVRQEKP